MADKYSVVYDPVAREPFAIISDSSGLLTAHPVQKSAEQWSISYNGGRKTIPTGMTSTEFVEMGCDFVSSFKSAFSRGERVSRRANLLSAEAEPANVGEIVYGTGAIESAKRKSKMSRKVMPAMSQLQKELFRSKFIQESIRTGKRWLRKSAA